MTDKLIEFRIPAEFVECRTRLTPRELKFGYDQGWLTAPDVVRLALNNVVPEPQASGAVEELSLLLSDELDRVPALVAQLAVAESDVWVWLTCNWLLDNAAEFEDPLQAVEMLYADLDYPDSMGPFVRYMPLTPGAEPGAAGLMDRWAAYVRAGQERFGTGYRQAVDPGVECGNAPTVERRIDLPPL
ncbi:DUF2247 family protein [Nocardia stercoris]|uniref:DUF2247 family protein n=1 Tax=Nocardia stercoris TaxID=2483361 RepID=A0A3M2L6V8_9NOCA|nr:DUF2247 family protein [Nocardia stercoris]RMI32273.1 DUF2247 family protein [Nocardia stercoris]